MPERIKTKHTTSTNGLDILKIESVSFYSFSLILNSRSCSLSTFYFQFTAILRVFSQSSEHTTFDVVGIGLLLSDEKWEIKNLISFFSHHVLEFKFNNSGSTGIDMSEPRNVESSDQRAFISYSHILKQFHEEWDTTKNQNNIFFIGKMLMELSATCVFVCLARRRLKSRNHVTELLKAS